MTNTTAGIMTAKKKSAGKDLGLAAPPYAQQRAEAVDEKRPACSVPPLPRPGVALIAKVENLGFPVYHACPPRKMSVSVRRAGASRRSRAPGVHCGVADDVVVFFFDVLDDHQRPVDLCLDAALGQDGGELLLTVRHLDEQRLRLLRQGCDGPLLRQQARLQHKHRVGDALDVAHQGAC